MIQLQMIDKTKSIAQNDKNISAVFMYGSFTKNEGDKYSDIEFYLFFQLAGNVLFTQLLPHFRQSSLCNFRKPFFHSTQ